MLEYSFLPSSAVHTPSELLRTRLDMVMCLCGCGSLVVMGVEMDRTESGYAVVMPRMTLPCPARVEAYLLPRGRHGRPWLF